MLDGMLGVLASCGDFSITVDISVCNSLRCRGCGTGCWGDACGGDASGDGPRSGDEVNGGLISRDSRSDDIERDVKTEGGWSENTDYNDGEKRGMGQNEKMRKLLKQYLF